MLVCIIRGVYLSKNIDVRTGVNLTGLIQGPVIVDINHIDARTLKVNSNQFLDAMSSAWFVYDIPFYPCYNGFDIQSKYRHMACSCVLVCLNHCCLITPYGDIALTLSQWSSSGNPVAIQCAWNLDPSVHWNATGERIVGSQCASSGLPVVFQWLSSGLPVCSNYAN